VFSGNKETVSYLKHLLDNALLNPEALLLAQSYLSFSNGQEHFPISSQTLPLPKHPDYGHGLSCLHNFIGEIYHINNYTHIVWERFFSESNGNPILLSEPIDEVEFDSWNQHIEQILKILSQKNVIDLRQSYLTEELPSEQVFSKKISRELLNSVMGFTEIEGKTHIYFDYQLLYSLIFPPYIDLEQNEKEIQTQQYCLCIAKRELIAYLRQTFESGFIMKEVEQGIVQPVLLPHPNPKYMKNVIYLLLDVSGSMSSCETTYVNKVQELVSKLKADLVNIDTSTVYLVPFSNQDKINIISLNLDDTDDQIIQTSMKCSGGTKIKGTLAQLFGDAGFNRHFEQAANVTCILFTDGDDVNSSPKDKIRVEQQKNRQLLPQIFTLGYGNYNLGLCNELAKITGGEFIALDDIDDLLRIEQHFSEISAKRELVEFIQTLQNEVITRYYSVYDQPFEIDVTLEDSNVFSINGITYTVYKNNYPAD